MAWLPLAVLLEGEAFSILEGTRDHFSLFFLEFPKFQGVKNARLGNSLGKRSKPEGALSAYYVFLSLAKSLN